jgi:hypothetical protein
MLTIWAYETRREGLTLAEQLQKKGDSGNEWPEMIEEIANTYDFELTEEDMDMNVLDTGKYENLA